MGTPIYSIKEEGIGELIDRIRIKLRDMPVHSLEIIEKEPCFYDHTSRSFDLSKIYWIINIDNNELCGPIKGGREYLEHIQTCSGCLYALKVDLNSISPLSRQYRLAEEFAERIFLKSRKHRN